MIPRLIAFAGPCWRAVREGDKAAVLEGWRTPRRYNRPGERVLYMSGSPEGVTAAMARYGEASRVVVRLAVAADGLLGLRGEAGCAAAGIDVPATRVDWRAALDRGEEPPSWTAADHARKLGANGLLERSRHAPAVWHLVLFCWNEAGAPRVATTGR